MVSRLRAGGLDFCGEREDEETVGNTQLIFWGKYGWYYGKALLMPFSVG